MLSKEQVDNIAYNMAQHAKLEAVSNIKYDFNLNKLSKVRLNMIKRAFQLGLNDTGGDTVAIVRTIAEGLGIDMPQVPNGRDKYWGGSVVIPRDCQVDVTNLKAWAAAQYAMLPKDPQHPWRNKFSEGEYRDGRKYFNLPQKSIPSNWQARHKLYSQLITKSDAYKDKCQQAIKFVEQGGIIVLSFDEKTEDTRYEIRP